MSVDEKIGFGLFTQEQHPCVAVAVVEVDQLVAAQERYWQAIALDDQFAARELAEGFHAEYGFPITGYRPITTDI